MKLLLQKNISYPGKQDIETIKEIVRKCRQMKIGIHSFALDYMLWDRIGFKVRTVLKLENIHVISRRESGKEIKNTRVWRIR